MDNRLKHALGDRPNSEFILDPKGNVERKRVWSNPLQVRKDLEELAGPVAKITKEEDLKMSIQLPLKSPAGRGVVPRVKRPRMQPIVMEPVIEPKGQPFYAKLRVEADADLLNEGAGKLYLGFHLDPFQNAHWNNLTPPLKYKLELPMGAKIAKSTGEAAKVSFASDADPREFIIDVEDWPSDKPIKVVVAYRLQGRKACYAIRQEYVIRLKRDKDGGARGEGAGFWDAEQFANK